MVLMIIKKPHWANQHSLPVLWLEITPGLEGDGQRAAGPRGQSLPAEEASWLVLESYLLRRSPQGGTASPGSVWKCGQVLLSQTLGVLEFSKGASGQEHHAPTTRGTILHIKTCPVQHATRVPGAKNWEFS